MRRSQTVRVLTLALTGTATVAGGPSIAAPNDFARWQWLNDTFWYVPNEYRPGIRPSAGRRHPVAQHGQGDLGFRSIDSTGLFARREFVQSVRVARESM